MLAILREVLDNTADPLFVAYIDEAHELLDIYELDDYTQEFEDLLGTFDDMDRGSFNIAVYELTRTFQLQVLRQHLVTASEGASVSNLNAVLRAIRQIEITEFTSEVITVLENMQDPTEAFIGILSIVSGRPEIDLAMWIKNAEISLLKRALEFVSKRIAVEALPTIDHEKVNEVIERYKTFAASNPAEEPLLVTQCLKEGIQLLEPFEVYCRYIREHLVSADPKCIAREYVAAALVAGDLPALLHDPIVDYLSSRYVELNEITPIMIAVDQLLLQLSQHNTAGIKKVPA